MDFNDRLMLRYFRHVVATPEGRAHVLNQVADAENNGEQAVFDRALAHADDPELARMIQRHQADEVRHAELFRARIPATGVEPPPVPSHLKMIDRLDRALGGFFARPIRDRRDVMEAYLLLQVIEERACTLFPIFEEGFRDVDPVTAGVFAEVSRDEERHLKYCHAIARRYAPSAEVHDRTLRELRRVEARCFAENGFANMRHAVPRGFLDVGPVAAYGWLALGAASRVLRPEPPTRFWAEPKRTSRNDAEPRAASMPA